MHQWQLCILWLSSSPAVRSFASDKSATKKFTRECSLIFCQSLVVAVTPSKKLVSIFLSMRYRNLLKSRDLISRGISIFTWSLPFLWSVLHFLGRRLIIVSSELIRSLRTGAVQLRNYACIWKFNQEAFKVEWNLPEYNFSRAAVDITIDGGVFHLTLESKMVSQRSELRQELPSLLAHIKMMMYRRIVIHNLKYFLQFYWISTTNFVYNVTNDLWKRHGLI